MNAEQIYDAHTDLWVRREPILLSDYSARPRVLQLCGNVQGKTILDLGCGEGYVSRQLLAAGAQSVTGHDVSASMIDGARKTAEQLGLSGLDYSVVDLRRADFGDPKDPVDLVIAVFLFNYMDTDSMSHILRRVRSVLKPGGQFIFTVPHPMLPWIKPAELPFYMQPKGGYLSSVDVPFPGRIWRRDGESVEVQAVHKTFTTYFTALREAGYTDMPLVEELHITDEHVALDPDFFGPLVDLPLHVAFSLTL
ncbi:MAG: class I SAM-dependent methyltransferase [Flavobacteriales bacterium]|nr:class I SAM-dependent methyltransferase [Flavobacteriales bacterium]